MEVGENTRKELKKSKEKAEDKKVQT